MPNPNTILPTLLLCTLLCACAAVQPTRSVSDIQDAFDAAAALDNATRYGALEMPPDLGSVVTLGRVNGAYAAVIAEARAIDPATLQQLRDDGLYGTVRILEALAHWRLGNAQESLAVAEELRSLGAPAVLRRDLLLAEAIPALIRNDQARRAMREDPSRGGRDSKVTPLREAMETLASLTTRLDADDPLRLYLDHAAVLVAINLVDAIDQTAVCSITSCGIDIEGRCPEALCAALDAGKARLYAFCSATGDLSDPGDTRTTLLDRYARKLRVNLRPDAPGCL